MKKLFALMALAGLAAFQVGCGDSAPATKPTPPSGTSNMSPAAGMPAAGAPADKKEEGDKKDEAAADADKDKPAADAAADGDKKDEGDKKEGE